jgi:tRNA-dihydrouridine synthase
MIYLAPLQGLTDYIFRDKFMASFRGIDTCFIPYISIKNGEIAKKMVAEVSPENNRAGKVIPQVLFGNESELDQLIRFLAGFGNREINLNLGCPYPKVTNRGRGAGLLNQPELLYKILEKCLSGQDIRFSVKLRSGLEQKEEIFPNIEVLNQFPLTEIIYHPRVARQLYKGSPDFEPVGKVIELSRHPVVLNGDIFSVESYLSLKNKFPAIRGVMLGRGILMNPFLAEEISGIATPADEKTGRLREFHQQLFDAYSRKLSGGGHLLVKMKTFWEYFSSSFGNSHKVYKLIKKAGSVNNYNEAVARIFSGRI